MSQSVQVAIIAAIPLVLTALTGLVALLLRRVNATQTLVQKIELSINSRMDKLLALTATSSRAEGRADEVAAQLAGVALPPVSPDQAAAVAAQVVSVAAQVAAQVVSEAARSATVSPPERTP